MVKCYKHKNAEACSRNPKHCVYTSEHGCLSKKYAKRRYNVQIADTNSNSKSNNNSKSKRQPDVKGILRSPSAKPASKKRVRFLESQESKSGAESSAMHPDFGVPKQTLVRHRTGVRRVKHELNFCSGITFRNIRVLHDKNSASDSTIYFAQIADRHLKGKRDVVIKEYDESKVVPEGAADDLMSPVPAEMSVTRSGKKSLAVRMTGDMIYHEARMYGVTTKMVQRLITPHVVSLLGVQTCSKNPRRFRLITETGFTQGRGQALDAMTHTQQVSADILVPIVYTLAAFAEYGVSHNDLHTDNILVQNLRSRIPVVGYRISKNHMLFLRNVRHFPLLFDFDRAHKQPTKFDAKGYDVPHQFWLAKYYNHPANYFKDLFTLLCYLYKNDPTNKVIRFLLNGVKITTDGETKFVQNPGRRAIKQPLGFQCAPFDPETHDNLAEIPKIMTPTYLMQNPVKLRKLVALLAAQERSLNKVTIEFFPAEKIRKMLHLPHMYQLPSVAENVSKTVRPSQEELKLLWQELIR